MKIMLCTCSTQIIKCRTPVLCILLLGVAVRSFASCQITKIDVTQHYATAYCGADGETCVAFKYSCPNKMIGSNGHENNLY
jgi:hypothetical protein